MAGHSHYKNMAHRKGIVLVAAVGNAGPLAAPLYPGADPNVIGVTAVDRKDAVFNRAVHLRCRGSSGRSIAIARSLDD